MKDIKPIKKSGRSLKTPVIVVDEQNS